MIFSIAKAKATIKLIMKDKLISFNFLFIFFATLILLFMNVIYPAILQDINKKIYRANVNKIENQISAFMLTNKNEKIQYVEETYYNIGDQYHFQILLSSNLDHMDVYRNLNLLNIKPTNETRSVKINLIGPYCTTNSVLMKNDEELAQSCKKHEGAGDIIVFTNSTKFLNYYILEIDEP